MNCWIVTSLSLLVLAAAPELVSAQASAASGAQPAARPPSAEQAPAGYSELVDQAVNEHQLGNFEEAHTLYGRAHALWPSARTLNYLAMTEFELKRYAVCIEHLQQALASNVRPLRDAQRVKAEDLLARARGYVSRVVLELSPEGAHVLIDGVEPERAADGAFALTLGEHAIDVSADGHRAEQRKLLVKGGDEQVVRIALQSLTPPTAPPPPLSAPAAMPAAAPVAAKTPTPAPAPALAPDERDADSSVWKSPWLWTGAVVVVAGAVLAVLLLAPDTRQEPADPVRTDHTPPGVAVMALTAGGH